MRATLRWPKEELGRRKPRMGATSVSSFLTTSCNIWAASMVLVKMTMSRNRSSASLPIISTWMKNLKSQPQLLPQHKVLLRNKRIITSHSRIVNKSIITNKICCPTLPNPKTSLKFLNRTLWSRGRAPCGPWPGRLTSTSPAHCSSCWPSTALSMSPGSTPSQDSSHGATSSPSTSA